MKTYKFINSEQHRPVSERHRPMNKEIKMKTYKWVGLLCGAYLPLLALVVVTLATSFHAKAAGPPRVLGTERQSEPAPPNVFAMTLLAPAEVNGLVLGRGEYTVNWSQQGGGMMMTFAQRGVIRATAHGAVVTRPDPARYSLVLTRATASGVNTITEIQFEGKRSSLALAPAENPRAARPPGRRSIDRGSAPTR